MTQARILVVEDDNGLREALVDTLLLGGYECREVDSGERALLALSRQRFDMVISDIQMGGMDGLTLLANIRQQYPQVPVLLMTAYANIDLGGAPCARGRSTIWPSPSPRGAAQPGQPLCAGPEGGEAGRGVRGPQDCGAVPAGDPGGEKRSHRHGDRPERDGQGGVGSLHSRPLQPGRTGLVAINCAAIPENMLEATLFGYEKGAFTGAVQGCPGKFEQAQEEPCCSTRSPRWIWDCRPSCCGSCRRKRWSGSAAAK